MRIGKAIGNIVKVAIVLGCIYAFLNWETIKPQKDEISGHAEQACITEIRNRFATTSLKSYSVKKNNNGYVVRASATLARGNTIKIYCLTNEHGGVEEVRVEER